MKDLKDWTLAEVQMECIKNNTNCGECKIGRSGCPLKDAPSYWALYDNSLGTPYEIADCIMYGARYVSRDAVDGEEVSLWGCEPEKSLNGNFVSPGGPIVRVLARRFPSVKKGEYRRAY